MATYLLHNNRFYHATEVHHTGPSVSRAEFGRGWNPAPRRSLVTTQAPRPAVEYYAAPDVGRLVTQRQQGQPLPALTPRQPTTTALACPTCRQVRCRCGVGKPGGLDAIVALQRAQGKMA